MGLRVLLVDDEPPMRAAIRNWIRSKLRDSEVIEAGSLESALRAMEAGRPDLVLTDVVLELPDAGWHLARAARTQGVPVLLMSGDEQAPERGASDELPLLTKRELIERDFAELVTCVLASQSGT